jgi:hypothetical protein
MSEDLRIKDIEKSGGLWQSLTAAIEYGKNAVDAIGVHHALRCEQVLLRVSTRATCELKFKCCFLK